MAHTVTMTMPAHPLPARSFLQVRVSLAAGSGVQFSDLAFELPDGTPAGRISVAPDATISANGFVLLVGNARGPHAINAVDQRNGKIVGKQTFEISDGESGVDGPSLWAVR